MEQKEGEGEREDTALNGKKRKGAEREDYEIVFVLKLSFDISLQTSILYQTRLN